MVDIFEQGEGFGIELDGGAVENADDLYAGNRVNQAGYYHVTANGSDIKRPEGKLPQIAIDMQILDGTDEETRARAEAQIGKSYTHYIYLAKWKRRPGTNGDDDLGETEPLEDAAQKGIRALAYAFGLLSEADLTTPNVRVPFHMIGGRQAIIRIQKQKDYESGGEKRSGGYKMSWNNDAWPVLHEKVKDVHKDPSALAMLQTAGVGAGGNGAASPDIDDI